MPEIVFQEQAWADYLWWQTNDRRSIKRINGLIKAILRDPTDGIGKPEPLRGGAPDRWSRRIDASNRLVYIVATDRIIIAACRTHHGDH